MPMWTSPETSPAERIVAMHHDITGNAPVQVADAPATWVVIGENVDHYGGVTIVGLSSLRSAACYSLRDDDTVRVTFTAPGAEQVTEETTLADVAAIAQAQHAEFDEVGDIPERTMATRFAGIVHTLITRQMLSRDTSGMDITIDSDIPLGIGLGSMYAADAALALALQADNEDLDEAPQRARLAEVCTQAVDQFSSMPVLRARHTAVLRGIHDTVSVVDYADDSVTQAPHPKRAGVRIFAVTKDIGHADDSQAELISTRRDFITNACQNFGTDSLRTIPDATVRVIEWLEAVHQVHGVEDTPTLDEANRWLTFCENETLRALAAAKALRSRHTNDLFALLNTPEDFHGLDTPDELVQLLNLRGAAAARPSAAGMSQAVIAYVPVPKADSFAADLADDGFHVIEIMTGDVAGLKDQPEG
ncbi:galactokinase [Corynebacterium breve]|uniref:Galactokinase n=1 Tax=Corynebacterium breve TaxID=3049799 RepID=A0ABY8VCI1_9CORY|nr:galactokinase [Corynebacterium breve]WIM67032.1 galactokinase [Corynebacterium breve]